MNANVWRLGDGGEYEAQNCLRCTEPPLLPNPCYGLVLITCHNSFNLNLCFESLPPLKSVYNNIIILTNDDIDNH